MSYEPDQGSYHAEIVHYFFHLLWPQQFMVLTLDLPSAMTGVTTAKAGLKSDFRRKRLLPDPGPRALLNPGGQGC